MGKIARTISTPQEAWNLYSQRTGVGFAPLVRLQEQQKLENTLKIPEVQRYLNENPDSVKDLDLADGKVIAEIVDFQREKEADREKKIQEINQKYNLNLKSYPTLLGEKEQKIKDLQKQIEDQKKQYATEKKKLEESYKKEYYTHISMITAFFLVVFVLYYWFVVRKKRKNITLEKSITNTQQDYESKLKALSELKNTEVLSDAEIESKKNVIQQEYDNEIKKLSGKKLLEEKIAKLELAYKQGIISKEELMIKTLEIKKENL
ncbi:MAG: hypothetical protein LBE36_14365 [Flavobacteriaceae bacterium]|jgi:hypothetical protein|nr:hypothetical protein [Flavobacteriaceae bacterium]